MSGLIILKLDVTPESVYVVENGNFFFNCGAVLLRCK